MTGRRIAQTVTQSEQGRMKMSKHGGSREDGQYAEQVINVLINVLGYGDEETTNYDDMAMTLIMAQDEVEVNDILDKFTGNEIDLANAVTATREYLIAIDKASTDAKQARLQARQSILSALRQGAKVAAPETDAIMLALKARAIGKTDAGYALLDKAALWEVGLVTLGITPRDSRCVPKVKLWAIDFVKSIGISADEIKRGAVAGHLNALKKENITHRKCRDDVFFA